MLLFCITILNGETRRINEKTLRRMIEHMTKIKNFMRNLNDGSTSILTTMITTIPTTTPAPTTFLTTPAPTTILTTIPSTSPSSNSSDYSTPLTANPGFAKKKKNARINFLAFNSFRIPSRTYFTFAVFVFFRSGKIAQNITFTLVIRYRFNRLRYLQEKNETATCTPESNNINQNIKYSCNSPKDENLDIQQVAITDVNIDGNPVDLADINFSDEALLAASNLQDYTQNIDEMYDLKNGILKQSSKYFVIEGVIDDDRYQGHVGDKLNLSVLDNSTDTIKIASCEIESVKNKNYVFKCTHEDRIYGYLDLASMYSDNKAINLHMEDGHENLSFEGNSNNGNTYKSNPIYKKSSSGLSGGAIAGIVIACAVVLIVASIIAMMLRKPSVPIKNNSSITELRSIDNYTQ